jgi:hypothetical protein
LTERELLADQDGRQNSVVSRVEPVANTGEDRQPRVLRQASDLTLDIIGVPRHSAERLPASGKDKHR